MFKEFLSIRQSSPLFKLTSAQAVYDRVGFHNTGTSQTKGLIVMSIDDGTGLADIDQNNDAIVVLINGTSVMQSHTILTASGFTLHPIQQASTDMRMQTANFVESSNSGTFSVPALTTAVFVKKQKGAQSHGLSAGVTRDAPDVAPFGNNTLYIRGSMNNNGQDGFTDADSFSYDGNGIYSLNYTLNAGEQTFTITSENGSTVDLGYSDVSIGAHSIALSNNNNSFSFTADVGGSFALVLDASGAMPILTLSSKSPTVNCQALADSDDPIPFTIAGGGQLYVRGDHSGWGADETYRMHYKGNNIYQTVADFDGDMQFKLASDDGSWTTQLWAQADGGTEINTDKLTVGINYGVAYKNAGTDNNTTTLNAGTYSIKLTLNEDNPAQGNNVGSMIIQACNP